MSQLRRLTLAALFAASLAGLAMAQPEVSWWELAALPVVQPAAPPGENPTPVQSPIVQLVEEPQLLSRRSVEKTAEPAPAVAAPAKAPSARRTTVAPEVSESVDEQLVDLPPITDLPPTVKQPEEEITQPKRVEEPPQLMEVIQLEPLPAVEQETLPAVSDPEPADQSGYGFVPLNLRSIQELTTDTAAPPGEFPADYASRVFDATPVYDDRVPSCLWNPLRCGRRVVASCHRPLYFEEYGAERFGHHWGILQPAVSGAHFFGTIPILPYKMGAQPAWRVRCEDGPCCPNPFDDRFSISGALTQAAVVTSLFFIFP